jgi:hypothetical protein
MSAYQPTPFAKTLLRECMRWRSQEQGGADGGLGAPMWSDWLDGIHRDYRDLAAELTETQAIRLHSHVAALNSSMAFAFNLFLPFHGDRDLGGWLAPSLGALVLDEVHFEWLPPGDLLAETAGNIPQPSEPATSVDVLLRGKRDNGKTIAVLVEVKLSEGGFSTCNGRTSPANSRPEICASAERFFADPQSCYLRRPKRARRDRRYWEILTTAFGSVRGACPGASEQGPCPYAGDAQQPMRQHALALAMEQNGLVDEAWLALVHHDDNPDIPPPWQGYCDMAPDGSRLLSQSASSLLGWGQQMGLGHWASWMAGRYQLEVR